MRRVIHLLPYDGIGGAEAAARSMSGMHFEDFDFELVYIFPDVRSSSRRSATFNPLAFLRATLAVSRMAPDLLVVSLWRACIVALMVKMLRPGTRIVVVIHNSVDAHAGDWLFTRVAMRLAEAIWADSKASMRLRFRRHPRAPVTVLPFLTQRLEPALPRVSTEAPSPTFIFWGRLAAQKNLLRSLAVFKMIHTVHPDARFTVIGPDSGDLPALQAWCVDAGLMDAVRFTGAMTFDDIRRLAAGHDFYLQTSDYEGMAMSVVEAMQLGLVPVVTPVGEIARYCRDNQNAVVVHDDAAAAQRVLALLSEPMTYDTMRTAAIATWRDHPLYRDAVAAECRRLLAPMEI